MSKSTPKKDVKVDELDVVDIEDMGFDPDDLRDIHDLVQNSKARPCWNCGNRHTLVYCDICGKQCNEVHIPKNRTGSKLFN